MIFLFKYFYKFFAFTKNYIYRSSAANLLNDIFLIILFLSSFFLFYLF